MCAKNTCGDPAAVIITTLQLTCTSMCYFLLLPAVTSPTACCPFVHQQSAPIDQRCINKLPPALTRRYDVYIHTEKHIPRDPSDPASQQQQGGAGAGVGGGAGAGGSGSNKGSTTEYPITPLRRVAAEHIGKLVRIRVSARLCCVCVVFGDERSLVVD